MKAIQNRYINTAIHIAIWTLIFLIPRILISLSGSDVPKISIGNIVSIVSLISIFYLNHRFLVDKYLFKGRFTLFCIWNIAFIAIVCSCIYLLHNNLIWERNMDFIASNPKRMMHHLRIVLSLQSLLLICSAGASIAIKSVIKVYETRTMVQEIEKEKTKAELQHLRSQLNPHFLFNTMNNVYALTAFDPERAQLYIHKLCEMMRYQLYESNQEFIPLSKEIVFMNNYCELMALRLPKHVKLSVRMPELSECAQIAPLLFISLIENAFKHGVSSREESYIDIELTYSNSQVELTVKNSYHPKSDDSGSGIGISNLHRRLELIYPDSHSILTDVHEGEYITTLTIKNI